jgi:preprotein translocase subunit SecA
MAPAGALALAAAAGSALGGAGLAADDGMAEFEEELPPPVEQRRVDHEHQLGRNDPCWCGSGKKFKKCHGA